MSNWLYVNNASSEVIAVDGSTVVIKSADAGRFGNPTPEKPLRLSLFDAEDNPLDSLLIVTARSGSTLTVSEGTAEVGNKLAAVPLAEDLDEIQTALAGKQGVLPLDGEAGQFLAYGLTWESIEIPNLSDYYDKDAVNDLLEAKEDSLPDSDDPSKFLNGNREWVTPDYATTSTTDGLDTLLTAAEGSITTLGTSKEPTIPTGTASQYVKGNKTLGTFAADAIAALPAQSGHGGSYLKTDGTNLSWDTPTSGGTPGGSSGQIQFNDSGAFGGSSSLVYDSANKRVGISVTPVAAIDVQANSTDDIARFRNSSGTTLVKIPNDGGCFPQRVRFAIARYVDLAAGTNVALPGIAAYAGTIAKVHVLATTNPVGGGFTFDVKKNGSSIFSSGQVIAANTQTLQTITSFANTAVSAGDIFTIDISSPGTGVQNVVVELIYLARNQ